jgi:hypothetical protein
MVENVPLPSGIADGERTVSDLFPGDDGADGVVIESVDKVVDEVIVEEDATQPEETLLTQTFKEAGIRLTWR